MKNLLTITMIGGTALASIVSSPAFAIHLPETPVAQDPDGQTLMDMQDACNDLASDHGPDWSGVLNVGSIVDTLISGPDQVGTRAIVGEIEGVGDPTPSDPFIAGDPYRNGGSVNMFGDQRASAVTYEHSRYLYNADFESVFSFAFRCSMSQSVFVPAQGRYVVNIDAHGNEEAHQRSCDAFNAIGPTFPHWGNDHAQCDFITTDPAHYEDQDRGSEAGEPIDVTQTDSLMGHEENGDGFEVSGDLFIGKVVVCISPSGPTRRGVPGEWRRQNGYTGDKCTTNWFNVAPWGGGSQTSNGTYISVPPAT